MSTEEIIEQRNLFHAGNYQSSINAGVSLNLSGDSDAAALSKVYIYRCYVCQQLGHLVLAEVQDEDATPIYFKAVRLLAEYASGSDRDAVVQKALSLADSLSVAVTKGELHGVASALVGSVLVAERRFDEARALLEFSKSLECKYVLFHLFLSLDRPDMSEKVMRDMNAVDADDILSQLAFAHLALVAGHDKAQEAFLTLSEMISKYTATPLLLNLLAVAQMKLERWDDAYKTLLESLEKSSKDPETLANLVTCCAHCGKPKDVTERYKSQLQTVCPTHPLFAQAKAFADGFDKACEMFQ